MPNILKIIIKKEKNKTTNAFGNKIIGHGPSRNIVGW
jgi:ATP:corrinoid adenosyltransferase